MSYVHEHEVPARARRKYPVPICPECGCQARRVTGKSLYPEQRHLHHMQFYQCVPCDTRVGFNPRTGRPHGTLAGARLRQARQRAHRAFDPLWQSGQVSRTEAYLWLAQQMDLSINECHIGMFDEDQCDQVVALCVADDFEECT